jgi:hypothetical protein
MSAHERERELYTPNRKLNRFTYVSNNSKCANENANIQGDREFHTLSEYIIIFKKIYY